MVDEVQYSSLQKSGRFGRGAALRRAVIFFFSLDGRSGSLAVVGRSTGHKRRPLDSLTKVGRLRGWVGFSGGKRSVLSGLAVGYRGVGAAAHI